METDSKIWICRFYLSLSSCRPRQGGGYQIRSVNPGTHQTGALWAPHPVILG